MWSCLAVFAALLVARAVCCTRTLERLVGFACAFAVLVFFITAREVSAPLVPVWWCTAFTTPREVYLTGAVVWVVGAGLLLGSVFRSRVRVRPAALRFIAWGGCAIAASLALAGAVRSTRAPSFATYVERMPIVASLPAYDRDHPLDEPTALVGDARWTRDNFGVVFRRGAGTWRAVYGCNADLFRRLSIRHSAADALWVLEDDRGERCPFDERAERIVSLGPERVPGSPPLLWHLPAAAAAILGGALLARTRVRSGTTLVANAYRVTPHMDDVVFTERAPALVALAIAVVGCAPSVALAWCGFLW